MQKHRTFCFNLKCENKIKNIGDAFCPACDKTHYMTESGARKIRKVKKMQKIKEETCPHCSAQLVRNVVSHELGCPNESVYLGSDNDTAFMSGYDFWQSEQEPDDYGVLDDYDDCSGDY